MAVPVATGTGMGTVLSAQSAINTQGTVLTRLHAYLTHTLFVLSSGGVSGGVVTLQVSPDGTHWFSTATLCTTSAASTLYVATLAATPAMYVSAIISTGITGGTVTAWVCSAG